MQPQCLIPGGPCRDNTPVVDLAVAFLESSPFDLRDEDCCIRFTDDWMDLALRHRPFSTVVIMMQ